MDWVDRQVAYRYKGGKAARPTGSVNPITLFEERNKDMRSIGLEIEVDMSDCNVRTDVVARFNRPYGSDLEVLWPLNGYDAQNLIDDLIPWKEKKDILFWRGATSSYSTSERIDPIYIINSNRYPIPTNCKFSTIIQDRKKDVEPWMLGDHTPMDEWFKYKYILNLPGNDASSSFPFILNSNSVALHPYPFKWEMIYYADGIIPWVHFIPIEGDMSDLEEKIHWCKSHQDECKKIAERATEYIRPYRDPLSYSMILERIAKMINSH
jgi:hypothetical protein